MPIIDFFMAITHKCERGDEYCNRATRRCLHHRRLRILSEKGEEYTTEKSYRSSGDTSTSIKKSVFAGEQYQ